MDGIVIASIIYELKKNILGFNINKIYQPEPDEILLIMNKKKLLLSANACYPRICLLNEKKYKENPVSAPMFCMVLRKYILNAKVTSIKQINFDRIVKFELENINEFGDKFNYALIIEIMNKHSNIILLEDIDDGETNTIRVYIEWVNDEDNNEKDSELGTVLNNQISIPVSVDVTQYIDGDTLTPYTGG